MFSKYEVNLDEAHEFERLRFSQSLASLRQQLSQPIVRSTAQRHGLHHSSSWSRRNVCEDNFSGLNEHALPSGRWRLVAMPR
jgi:hypothetical protein